MSCTVSHVKTPGHRACSLGGLMVSLLLLTLHGQAEAQGAAFQKPNTSAVSPVDKIIIDTDIGMDIDDAFALALALNSPELQVLGFTTASGDTLGRAKIIDRMLSESGHADIPVAVGIPTNPPDSCRSIQPPIWRSM